MTVAAVRLVPEGSFLFAIMRSTTLVIGGPAHGRERPRVRGPTDTVADTAPLRSSHLCGDLTRATTVRTARCGLSYPVHAIALPYTVRRIPYFSPLSAASRLQESG